MKKKAAVLAAAVLLCAVWAAGCSETGAKKKAWDASENSIYVADDLSVQSAMVYTSQKENDLYSAEGLAEFAKKQICSYNEEQGAAAEAENTEGKEKVFEFLKNLLGKKYAQRKLFAEEDNLYGTVAAGSLYLLPAMLGKTYSLITGEEFWKTWEKLDFGTGYEDIIRPKNDVLPIKGTEEDIEFYRALGKQNEDELMRYKGVPVSFRIKEA